MGHSRGGLTTKIHALVDAVGLPIALKFSEDQAHDGRRAVDMFDTLQAGNILLADRAYDSNALREWLAERVGRGKTLGPWCTASGAVNRHSGPGAKGHS